MGNSRSNASAICTELNSSYTMQGASQMYARVPASGKAMQLGPEAVEMLKHVEKMMWNTACDLTETEHILGIVEDAMEDTVKSTDMLETELIKASCAQESHDRFLFAVKKDMDDVQFMLEHVDPYFKRYSNSFSRPTSQFGINQAQNQTQTQMGVPGNQFISQQLQSESFAAQALNPAILLSIPPQVSLTVASKAVEKLQAFERQATLNAGVACAPLNNAISMMGVIKSPPSLKLNSKDDIEAVISDHSERILLCAGQLAEINEMK